MIRSLIVYGSRHHGNTERMVRYLAGRLKIELVNAEAGEIADFAAYDLIGFASGMDFGKFYPSVTNLAGQLPVGKDIYALYTCARDHENYGLEIKEIARQQGCRWLGKYGCKGWNTYGPWNLIGGINKNHPSKEKLISAEQFYLQLLEQVKR